MSLIEENQKIREVLEQRIVENTTFQDIIRQNDSETVQMKKKMSEMEKRIDQLEQENVELRLKSSQGATQASLSSEESKNQQAAMREMLQEVSQLKLQLQQANETIAEKNCALQAMKQKEPKPVESKEEDPELIRKYFDSFEIPHVLAKVIGELLIYNG